MIDIIETEARLDKLNKEKMDQALVPSLFPFKIAPTAFPTHEDLDALAKGAWTDKQIVNYFASLHAHAKKWSDKRAKKWKSFQPQPQPSSSAPKSLVDSSSMFEWANWGMIYHLFKLKKSS